MPITFRPFGNLFFDQFAIRIGAAGKRLTRASSFSAAAVALKWRITAIWGPWRNTERGTHDGVDGGQQGSVHAGSFAASQAL
jgi:hypothetical protein